MKKLYLLNLLVFSFLHKISAQTFSSSNLPIIVIDTEGQIIRDEPKTKVKMQIIYNGVGKRNNLTDKNFIYNGFAGIEFRGSSSQTFPKKPYGIELWNEKSEENDVSLFGFPKESDFILFASYNEKSFMHNVLSMKLAREMGMYASRTQYVEVVINGEYVGLYVFMEKIKEAKGRVEISDLLESDTKGDQLTGGYIIKIDKSTGSNLGSWQSKYSNSATNPNARTTFFYEYPKNINSTQKNYIRSYVDSLELALYGSDYSEKTGYRKFLHTTSFVKYLLINELSKGVDCYRISTYMYKDRNSKGGKLKAGPPWDYDISYGNGNYCEGQNVSGFAYNFNQVCAGDFWQVPFWWDRLVRDPKFVQEIREEYVFQRKKGALQKERIIAHIDSMTTEIQEAQARNYQKWRTLGVYVWPQPNPISPTWEGEVQELRTWIDRRLAWLDQNMPGVYGNLSLDPLSNEPIDNQGLTLNVFPNPFIERLTLQINSPKSGLGEIMILDELGKKIYQSNQSLSIGENTIEIEVSDVETLKKFNYLRFEIGGAKVVKKLIRDE